MHEDIWNRAHPNVSAFVIGTYVAYMNYKWVANPPDWSKPEQVKAYQDELRFVALIAIIAQIVAIVGLIIFIIKFVKHKHPHEHEISAPRVVPPPL